MTDNHGIMGQNELREMVLDKGLCTGCGACIELCPYFKSYKGATAITFPCDSPQGRCFAYCPKIEVNLEDLSQKFFGKPLSDHPLGSYQEILVSKAGKKVRTAAFQAGGTVSALIYFAIKHGDLEGAVLTDHDGLLPTPRFIVNPEDVFECASSKYTAAPTLSALNKAVKDGFKKIGVVATPCQALATALLRTNPLKENAFIDPIGLVIGLFCTWALDFRAFEKYLATRVDIEKIAKIDIPPPPAEIMEIYFTKGENVEIPLDEIRPLVSPGCSYCIDMTSEFSDLSVGVLEGRPDMNTLIIRTERGRKVVDEACQAGYLEVSDISQDNLEHLIWAAANKKKRSLARAMQKDMINPPGKDTKAYLRLNTGTLTKMIA